MYIFYISIFSVNHRSPSSRVEEDADDQFEDAIQQLCEEKDHSIISTPQKKGKAATVTPKRSRSRFWRILKVAVPVQVALVLLYCLACYLEPSCCNSLNNFNFSFTPQLRYFGGRPPVWATSNTPLIGLQNRPCKVYIDCNFTNVKCVFIFRFQLHFTC